MGVRLDSAACRDELRWLVVTLCALSLAIAFEHFVIHREVILPTMQAGGSVPLWMWGAVFLPEMTVCVVAGWRIRSLTWLAVYAVVAGILRQGLFRTLTRSGEPGHVEAGLSSHGSFASGALLTGIVYFLLLGLASMTSREPGPVPNR